MKKYLIVFGICGIFFAGFVSAEWAPDYTTAVNYKECKYGSTKIKEKGVWITVPLDEQPKGGKCLKTGELVVKKKDDIAPDGACEKLSISYYAKKSEVELKIENKKYVVIDSGDVSCENGKCTIGENDKQEKVVCYEDKSFTKKITDSKATDFCVFEEKVDMKIKEIDFPRDKHPEWYCPYSWEGIYPENKDPYDSAEKNSDDSLTYFKEKLSDIYPFIPEDDQLTKDCSARMFALSKACFVNTQKKSKSREKILKIKSDYYDSKEEEFWKGMMEGKKARWDEVKNLSFKDICTKDKSKVDCDDSPYKDIKNNSAKVEGIKNIQSLLNTKEYLRESSETPNDYVKKEAKNEWEKAQVSDVKTILGDYKFPDDWNHKTGLAQKSYSELLSKATSDENSAKLVSKYISRRNMDLNISVSVSQTSSIKVSKYLQVIGDSEEDADDGSKESRLTFFGNKEGDINIIDKIIRLAVRTMGTLAILLLIISGVLMVISQGDENQLAKAKSTFIYTLVGLFVGFLSYIIVRFIIDMLLN